MFEHATYFFFAASGVTKQYSEANSASNLYQMCEDVNK